MAHPLYDVVDFRIVDNHTRWVKFDDLERVINFEPVLAGELSLFNQVQLDPEVRTLVWPNGADVDPWMLHEWPSLVERLAQRAKAWSLVPEAVT